MAAEIGKEIQLDITAWTTSRVVQGGIKFWALTQLQWKKLEKQEIFCDYQKGDILGSQNYPLTRPQVNIDGLRLAVDLACSNDTVTMTRSSFWASKYTYDAKNEP